METMATLDLCLRVPFLLLGPIGLLCVSAHVEVYRASAALIWQDPER